MKSCREFQEEISSLLDNQLSPCTVDELDEHLSSCSKCRAYKEEVALIHELAKIDVLEEAPPALKSGVLSKLDRASSSNENSNVFLLLESLLAFAACSSALIYGSTASLEVLYNEIHSYSSTLSQFYPNSLLSENPKEIFSLSMYPTILLENLERFYETSSELIEMLESSFLLSNWILALCFATIALNILLVRSDLDFSLEGSKNDAH